MRSTRKESRLHTDQEAVEPHHPTTTPPQTPPRIGAVLPRPHGKIHTEAHEYKKRKDLKRQPRNHDVNPILTLRRILTGRRIGQRSAYSLQYQRKEIGCDEDHGVGPRSEAGELLSVDDDDAGEAQIYAGGEETGGYGQDDEVPIFFFNNYDRHQLAEKTSLAKVRACN